MALAKLNHDDSCSSSQPESARALRPATTADYQEIIELFYQFDSLHYSLRKDYYQKPAKPGRSKQYILNAILNPLDAIWVYEQDGELVGLLHTKINPLYFRDAFKPKRTLAILAIVVKDPETRPEVSVAFAEHIIKRAKDERCSLVIADVDKDNVRARKFLAKFSGYEVTSRFHATIEGCDDVHDTAEDTLLVNRIKRKLIQIKIYVLALFWRP